MDSSYTKLQDVINLAREYEKTKSITAAVDCAKILKEWAKQPLGVNVVKGGDDEQ